jgi:O-antigen/teichoic acid export membrane protein
MIRSQVTNSLVFSSSRYVLIGLSAIRNIVVARYLGPEDYGLWVILLLILSYGDQIHLGLRHAGDREIPFFRGQGRLHESRSLTGTLYSAILFLSAVTLVVLLIYSLLADSSSPRLMGGVRIAGIILFSDQVNKFYLMVIRARKEFVLSSKVETAFELVRTVLVCALVLWVGLYGILIAYLIAAFTNTIYYLIWYDRTIVPGFDYRMFTREIRIGLPLFISGLLYLLIISLDRVIGAAIFSKEALGIYGFAALTAQLPVASSQAVGLVFYPEMSEKLGETADTSSLLPFFTKVTVTVAYIAPLLVASIVCGSELLIHWILPDYTESIGLIYSISSGVFFLAIAPIPLIVLMASGRPKYYLRAQIMSIIIAGGIYATVLLSSGTPQLLAVGAAASFVGYAVTLLVTAIVLFRLKASAAFREIATILLPCMYGAVILSVFYRLDAMFQSILGSTAEIQVLLRLLLFVILYIPLLWYIVRKYGLSDKLSIMLRKK